MKNSTCNFITGILVGAAAGVIAGILYAPDKGTETRRKIRENADNLNKDLKTKFEEIQKQVNETLDQFKGTEKKEEAAPPKKTTRSRKTSSGK
jgi:gas vesicle protein